MASFSTFPQTEAQVLAAVNNFKNSNERKHLITGLKYFEGENETIAAVKKYMWADPKKIDGKDVGGGFMENPYIANYKIPNGFFIDMVRQKVNTLLDETPTISVNDKTEIDKNFIKRFGYALKVAGTKAASQGKAFIFQAHDGELKVFDTENCIDYYDDETGELKGLVRFWYINTSVSNATNVSNVLYVEKYDEEGLTVYWNGNKQKTLSIKRNKTPYKYIRTDNVIETRTETVALKRLPIVLFKNNEKMKSDLTPNIRSKIDIIDIVGSGFANNIDDFSEIYWLIYNGGGMDSTYLEDFVSNINRTKKAILNGDGMGDGKMQIDTKQINIPTEARTKLIEMFKQDLIHEGGTVDVKSISASSLTQVAIKAALMKLRERVSDFEWEAYNVATEILEIYKEYNNLNFSFEIDFTELFLQNDTEILTNANSLRGAISEISYLTLVKRAGYIDDVDEELERLAAETKDKVTLIDYEEGDDGKFTQTDGQADSENGAGADRNIPIGIQ